MILKIIINPSDYKKAEGLIFLHLITWLEQVNKRKYLTTI
jgi:hypothetical protein